MELIYQAAEPVDQGVRWMLQVMDNLVDKDAVVLDFLRALSLLGLLLLSRADERLAGSLV